MSKDVAGATALSGDEVLRMVALAAQWLERNAAAIDAINVFPVPDGDTGSNMTSTLKAAVAAAPTTSAPAGTVLQALASGALMGARGNSGVILSQMFRGLAAGLAGAETLDAPGLAAALHAASETAYHAVGEPIEGTMLTVLRDVANAVDRRAEAQIPIIALFEVASSEALASVQRTPELLPMLREAGVVDSGGYGLAIIIDGCLRYLQGEQLPDEVGKPAAPSSDWLQTVQEAHGQSAGFGYCTEFIVEGHGLDADALRRGLQGLGDSVLVVGGHDRLRIHVHTGDPGAVLSFGSSLGSLDAIKVENMDSQHRSMLQTATEAAPMVSAVAVATGSGLEQILCDYGAVVVHGGQTMNPSTEEILWAIEKAPGRSVIVLPNNTNIIRTAEQAARFANKPVGVVATRSVPQGIAALLAMNARLSLEENTAAMCEAARPVHTAEITRAARRARIKHLQAREGQPIGLVDGEPCVTGETPEEAALASLEHLLTPSSSILTIYYGRDTDPMAADRVAQESHTRHLSLEIQVVLGGQPFYDYILSVE
ncbi:MAG: DAK2 domain-containing protein [Dehalococcoidia bacterium]